MKKRRLGAIVLAVSMIVSMLPLYPDVRPAAAAVSETAKLPTGDLLMEPVAMTSDSKQAVSDNCITNITESGDIGEVSYDSLASCGGGDYGYSTLSAKQKVLYDDAMAAFQAYMSSEAYLTEDYTPDSSAYDADNDVYVAFSLSGSLAFDYALVREGGICKEALQVYFALRHDNPQFYWISTKFYQSMEKFTVLIDPFYASAAKRAETEEAIQQGIEEYKALADRCSNNYEKTKVVHDRLIQSVEYAYNSAGKPETAIWAHSAAGAFCEEYNGSKGVVCEGYAKAYELILTELGIDNIYIVGTAAGGNHAWNAVQMDDGTYAYVDVTWDDAGSANYDGRSYAYFCVPATFFNKQHKANSYTATSITSWLYVIRASITDTMDYTHYNKYGANFSGLSSEEEARVHLKAAAQKSPNRFFHILADDASTPYICSVLGVTGYKKYTGLGNEIIASIPSGWRDIRPASSLKLNKNTADLDLDKVSGLTLTAIQPFDSEDTVKWEVEGNTQGVYLSNTTGDSCKISFGKTGTYTIVATAILGKKSAKCEITVVRSSAINGYDAIIWTNGKNFAKKVTCTSKLEPGSYTSSSGRTQKGKIGWIVKKQKTKLVFNQEKHRLTTKATAEDKAMGTITRKGVLTAKRYGTFYVYAYDTASMEVEEQIIEVAKEETQMRTALMNATISATNWYNEKNRVKKGKLIWIAKKEPTEIVFDAAKHRVKTRANREDRKIGTVNTRGLVTAKSEGTLYVYVCDTGSGVIQEFTVQIKNAPSSVKATRVAGSLSKEDKVSKSIELQEGESTGKIYIEGMLKDAQLDESCTYSVVVPDKYKDYVEISLKQMKDAKASVVTNGAVDTTDEEAGEGEQTGEGDSGQADADSAEELVDPADQGKAYLVVKAKKADSRRNISVRVKIVNDQGQRSTFITVRILKGTPA